MREYIGIVSTHSLIIVSDYRLGGGGRRVVAEDAESQDGGAHLSVYRWAKSPILATQSLSALEGSPTSVQSCISSAVVASGLLLMRDCRATPSSAPLCSRRCLAASRQGVWR